jgi:hypothetical protein
MAHTVMSCTMILSRATGQTVRQHRNGAHASVAFRSFALGSNNTGIGGGSFLSGLSSPVGRQQQPINRDSEERTTAVGSSAYVSPYQLIFDRMHANGPTTLGTTPELLELERQHRTLQRKLSCGILESDLRFASTSFGRTLMAPHVHPNEHRVVVKINTRNLPLDATGVAILREIVGNARYNEDRSELRLSSNQFGSRMENKRHLVSMLDRIILSCQRMASSLTEPPHDGTNVASKNVDSQDGVTQKEAA